MSLRIRQNPRTQASVVKRDTSHFYDADLYIICLEHSHTAHAEQRRARRALGNARQTTLETLGHSLV